MRLPSRPSTRRNLLPDVVVTRSLSCSRSSVVVRTLRCGTSSRCARLWARHARAAPGVCRRQCASLARCSQHAGSRRRVRCRGAAPRMPSNPELTVYVGPRFGEVGTGVDVQVSLMQEIQIGGERGRRVEAAERFRTQTEAEIDQVRWFVHADVHAAFHRALVERERARLAERVVEFQAEVLRVVERQIAAGAAAPLALRLAQAEVAQAQQQLVAAEQVYAASCIRLAQLSGWPVTTPPEPVGHAESPREPPALATLQTLARERVPSLVAGRARVQATLARVAVADREAWPRPPSACSTTARAAPPGPGPSTSSWVWSRCPSPASRPTRVLVLPRAPRWWWPRPSCGHARLAGRSDRGGAQRDHGRGTARARLRDRDPAALRGEPHAAPALVRAGRDRHARAVDRARALPAHPERRPRRPSSTTSSRRRGSSAWSAPSSGTTTTRRGHAMNRPRLASACAGAAWNAGRAEHQRARPQGEHEGAATKRARLTMTRGKARAGAPGRGPRLTPRRRSARAFASGGPSGARSRGGVAIPPRCSSSPAAPRT
jgi:hypothetical protein